MMKLGDGWANAIWPRLPASASIHVDELGVDVFRLGSKQSTYKQVENRIRALNSELALAGVQDVKVGILRQDRGLVWYETAKPFFRFN